MTIAFEVHSRDEVSDAGRRQLDRAEEMFGFVPNLIGVMSEAPPLAEAYMSLTRLFQKTSLSDAEQQIVLLAASRTNTCEYCMAAHSMMARSAGAPGQAVEAIRSDAAIEDAKLEALRRFTAAMVERRGRPRQDEIEAFLSAGYEKRHIFEVIVGVALKTLSNYTNHIAETPLDASMSEAAWTPPGA